jgi:hypothetical protein
LVSDVSMEVALLARLHGVPVLSVVLPGDRADSAHLLGYRVSHELVAAWPEGYEEVVVGLPDDVTRRIRHIGGLSRFGVTPGAARATPLHARRRARVAVLAGAGGTAVTVEMLVDAQRETPGWDWRVLAPPPVGRWVADPAPVLRAADVVVTHAGQNAVAEVAAVRRPAIVIPERRPHDEQEGTARALRGGRLPVTVVDSWDGCDWPHLLAQAKALDGEQWATWCDGGAADRFAGVITRLLVRTGRA